MSVDLRPQDPADLPGSYGLVDLDADVLPVPADELPVVFDDDGYPWDQS